MIPVWFLYLAGFSMLVLGVLQLLQRPHKPDASIAERFVNLGTFWSLLCIDRRRGPPAHGARLLAGAARPFGTAPAAEGSEVSLGVLRLRLFLRSLVTLAALRARLLRRHQGLPYAVAWKPCSRRDRSSRAPRARRRRIVDLELPTCASLSAPTATGTLHLNDPDGDAQVIKVTLYNGARSTKPRRSSTTPSAAATIGPGPSTW